MAKRTILFQSAHVTAIAQAGAGATTLVSFNEMSTVVDGDRFWGDALFAKQDIAAIGIVTPEPSWYPQADMQGAIAALRPHLQGRRVVTYGYSQGGYGALKYSKALDAAAAFAFCPQWSIDPADVKPHDTRFTAYFRPELRNGLRIEAGDLAANCTILFDKSVYVDLWNAGHLLAMPGVRAVPCPFTGHETIKLPAQSGRSGALIAAFLREADDYTRPLRQAMRGARQGSPTYHAIRANRLLDAGKRALVERLLRGVAADVALEARVRLAAANGRFEEARRLILASPPGALEYFDLLRCWRLCRDHGLADAELRVAGEILAYREADGHARLHSVHSLIKAGRAQDAKTALRGIVARFGDEIGVAGINAYLRGLG